MPSKVTPAHQEQNKEKSTTTFVEMFLMLVHTLFGMLGGQRHPTLPSFEALIKEKALTEYTYVPPDSTIIYISHEWVGNDHPDPHGDQMYHLLLMLERLRRGDVDRTDMDVFHSLVYKHNYTTTSNDWKRILNSQTTYIFYDGFCVPKEKLEEGFRMIPEYMLRDESSWTSRRYKDEMQS